MEIKSPLSGSVNTSIITRIAACEIIKLYKNSLNLEVAQYFIDIDEVLLCRDNETGYKFFYPEVNTDSLFYESLQEFDWYYMDWKWEYQKILGKVKKNDIILEVGCGKGDFIKRLHQQGNAVVGIEFNENSVRTLTSLGYEIFNKSLNNMSKEYPEKFDMVVSFQVLEHIYNVNDFIASSVALLKKNGKLIISVPNNDSFIKYAFPNSLNIPPHHAGWWTKDSLLALEGLFGLRMVNIYYEPLQKYHFDYYYETMKNFVVRKLGYTAKLLFLPLRSKRHRLLLNLLKNNIKGQTIIAVFKKE